MLTTGPQQSLVTTQAGAPVATMAGGSGSHRPNRRPNKPHRRRSGSQRYVVHGCITVTGQPVMGSIVVAGRYAVTGTRFQDVR